MHHGDEFAIGSCSSRLDHLAVHAVNRDSPSEGILLCWEYDLN